ncbi:MAG TPA: hypothetical protein VK703_05650 [Candidatus Acidoferrales bacterium]|nr:hypothetical protein [Candidatus Acidoferrales bacterium]
MTDLRIGVADKVTGRWSADEKIRRGPAPGEIADLLEGERGPTLGPVKRGEGESKNPWSALLNVADASTQQWSRQ